MITLKWILRNSTSHLRHRAHHTQLTCFVNLIKCGGPVVGRSVRKKKTQAVDIRGRNLIGDQSQAQARFVVHFLRCVTRPDISPGRMYRCLPNTTIQEIFLWCAIFEHMYNDLQKKDFHRKITNWCKDSNVESADNRYKNVNASGY